MAHHLYWWHRNPVEAGEWIEKKLTKKRMKFLKGKTNEVNKEPLEYDKIWDELAKEVERYGEQPSVSKPKKTRKRSRKTGAGVRKPVRRNKKNSTRTRSNSGRKRKKGNRKHKGD